MPGRFAPRRLTFHNESDNVAPLIGEIGAALDGAIDYEIIYVDDGSSDETPRALKECAAANPRLRIITHDDCRGQSTAIATGVSAARASIIATLDGDGQNDPADIPRLLAALIEAPDASGLMVAGHRKVRRDTWVKRMSSRIANRVRSRMLDDDTPDTGCGLKVFPRQLFMDMPHFDHLHRFLPALTIRQGGRVMSVPVNHRPRQHGTTNYGLFDRLWVGISDLFGVAWLMKRPIKTIDSDKSKTTGDQA